MLDTGAQKSTWLDVAEFGFEHLNGKYISKRYARLFTKPRKSGAWIESDHGKNEKVSHLKLLNLQLGKCGTVVA